MLDLKKLEAKFDEFFEKETPESFSKWLQEKKEIMSLLGECVKEEIQKEPITSDKQLAKIIDYIDNLPEFDYDPGDALMIIRSMAAKANPNQSSPKTPTH